MSQGLLVPAHLVANATTRAETCAVCKWRWKPNQTTDVECRAHPPTASLNLVPVEPKLMRPGMAPMELRPYSLFPLVQDDMWCGEFAPRVPQ